MALITYEHITEARQAISEFPQGLVGHNHDGPHAAVLEVCHLQCRNQSAWRYMTPPLTPGLLFVHSRETME